MVFYIHPLEFSFSRRQRQSFQMDFYFFLPFRLFLFVFPFTFVALRKLCEKSISFGLLPSFRCFSLKSNAMPPESIQIHFSSESIFLSRRIFAVACKIIVFHFVIFFSFFPHTNTQFSHRLVVLLSCRFLLEN